MRLRPLALFLLALTPASLSASHREGEDTVVVVQRGQVLVGEGFSGRVVVEGWGRDRVELVEEGGEGRVTLRTVGNRIVLGARAGRRAGGSGAVRLRVPAWMPVQLRGAELSAAVSGLTAAVHLSSVEGDLVLEDVEGDLFASTVEGSVSVERAGGRLRLRSVEEGVRVARVDGASVLVESTSGAIVLEDVSATSVEVTTTDGDVSFSGSLRPGGSYRLATHDGDLTVALADDADAVVTVSTFAGEFVPEMPITLERFTGGKQMSFTLGSGGARLTLSAFDGDIVLRRR